VPKAEDRRISGLSLQARKYLDEIFKLPERGISSLKTAFQNVLVLPWVKNTVIAPMLSQSDTND
jgi:hypothetical protein